MTRIRRMTMALVLVALLIRGIGQAEQGSFSNVPSDAVVGDHPPARVPPPAPGPAKPAENAPVIVPSAGANVLVIPTTDVVPQRFAQTAEDMQVMLQVLREKLTEPQMIRGTLIEYGDFFSDLDRSAQVFHLQGHAVMFVIRVDFPLLPPGAAPAKEEEAEPGPGTVDLVWQRARQRLYSPMSTAAPGGLPAQTAGAAFERVKETLLQSLKHAANIRNVGPDELIVLTVISQAPAGGPRVPVSSGGSFSNRGGAWFEGGSYSTSSASFGPAGGSTYADSKTYSRGSNAGPGRVGRMPGDAAPGAPTTVLTIQATKGDIDVFAKGGLSFEQFQQRVKTFTY
jgi:hypothetical protein